VFNKRVYLITLIGALTALALIACSEEQVPTQEPIEFHPTAADAVEREVQELPTAAAETPSEGGDAAAGESLFVSCSSCHSTTDAKVVGPGLGGVFERASSRTSLDAEAYLEESIRQPGAYVVDGFPPVMPSFDYLSDDDIQNLIAYLKTLN
jgi:cytochrome c oxidase subunit 2